MGLSGIRQKSLLMSCRCWAAVAVAGVLVALVLGVRQFFVADQLRNALAGEAIARGNADTERNNAIQERDLGWQFDRFATYLYEGTLRPMLSVSRRPSARLTPVATEEV